MGFFSRKSKKLNHKIFNRNQKTQNGGKKKKKNWEIFILY